MPEIPGIENEKVAMANDVLLGKKGTGEPVVVLVGGLIGCDTAFYLAQMGKEVTIVKVLENVARDMQRGNRMCLLELLAETKVEILTETDIVDSTEEGITIADKYGNISRWQIP